MLLWFVWSTKPTGSRLYISIWYHLSSIISTLNRIFPPLKHLLLYAVHYTSKPSLKYSFLLLLSIFTDKKNRFCLFLLRPGWSVAWMRETFFWYCLITLLANFPPCSPTNAIRTTDNWLLWCERLSTDNSNFWV